MKGPRHDGIVAGIDAGKRAHHCVEIDQTGTVLLSKRVENDEQAQLELIATTAEIAAGEEVCWATDLNAGGAALLIELLARTRSLCSLSPDRLFITLQRPIAGMARPMRKTRESSPTRPVCELTSNRFAVGTRSRGPAVADRPPHGSDV